MAEKLTRAQVFNAADAISKAGQAPTVAGVRAKIGTGSYTTITAMLREWKEQANEPDDETLDVPEEITQALGRAAEIVWKAAQDHFARELATVKKEAERTTGAALAQATEALQEIARLEQTIDATVQDNVTVTQALALAEQNGRDMNTRCGILTAELGAAQARITEQADLLRRLTNRTESSPPESTDAPATPKPTKRKTTPRKAPPEADTAETPES